MGWWSYETLVFVWQRIRVTSVVSFMIRSCPTTLLPSIRQQRRSFSWFVRFTSIIGSFCIFEWCLLLERICLWVISGRLSTTSLLIFSHWRLSISSASAKFWRVNNCSSSLITSKVRGSSFLSGWCVTATSRSALWSSCRLSEIIRPKSVLMSRRSLTFFVWLYYLSRRS